jgi:hypothetical protein
MQNESSHLSLVDEGLALGNVALELGNSGIDQALLVLVDLANGVNLLNTVGSELNVGGEELNTLLGKDGGLDEGGLDNVLLAGNSGLEKRVGEAGTSESHGKGGGASAVLSLDNLVATELDAVGQSLDLLLSEAVARLGEERDDGDTRVTSNDGDLGILSGDLLDLRDEAGGTDDIKGGDTEQSNNESTISNLYQKLVAIDTSHDFKGTNLLGS